MLKQLKFVSGAVAKDDHALSHFRIEGQRITGYNGTLAISAPIALEIECKPHAAEFIKAIANCEGDTAQLHITPARKLSVRSGGYRKFVDLLASDLADIRPEGKSVAAPPALLDTFKILLPFVSTESAHAWACGILVDNGSAYATNNALVITAYMGAQTLPHVINVPRAAVREIVRINEAPIGMQYDDRSVTFHYTDQRWLRTQLIDAGWQHNPRETVTAALSSEHPSPTPPGLFEALARVADSADRARRVYLNTGRVQTMSTEDDGAMVDVPGLPAAGCFNIDTLLSLSKIAGHMRLREGKPLAFYGSQFGVHGAVMGMRG